MKTGKIKKSGLLLLRNRLGVSQRTMAIYLNVNLSTIKLAELGQRTLPTAALIKVAKMEIKLQDTPLQVDDTAIHPAEQIAATAFIADFKQLFELSSKFQYDSYFLERKLELLAAQYKKTREKLQVLEVVLPEIENDDLKTESLERQYAFAKQLLVKCGQPAQALLKCRITILEAQKNLYDQLQLQLKQTMPTFLFEDTAAKNL